MLLIESLPTAFFLKKHIKFNNSKASEALTFPTTELLTVTKE